MAQAYRETTVWVDNTSQINHTYWLEGDHMAAYIPHGTGQPVWFKTPIRISRSGRKFEPVSDHLFVDSVSVTAPSTTIQVRGSRGDWYTVDQDLNTCTCPGYTYRGTCKHVKLKETV